MNRRALALLPVLVTAALTGPALAPAVAATGEIHVARTGCTPAGDGSPAAPFCTIGAGLAVVEPGQTVLVHAGTYTEEIRVTRSGTPAAPITLRAVPSPAGQVYLRTTTPASPATFITLDGVHDVVVDGFIPIAGGARVPPVVVSGSSRVTINRLSVQLSNRPAVHVTGGSSAVTVSRGSFTGTAGSPRIAVDGGSTNTVITTNTTMYGPISVTDAPGTVVAGNTMVNGCLNGVVVAGTSTGTMIRNNVIVSAGPGVAEPTPCANPATATAVSVAATAQSGTSSDHNLIDPRGGGALYRWGDADYPTIESFRAATGQGAHDIAAPAGLESVLGGSRSYVTLSPTSPAIDSADGTAAGALATDTLDNAHTDAPTIANTGAGGGYRDRGAVERQGPIGIVNQAKRKVGGHPFDVQFALTLTPSWPSDGPVGQVAARKPGERLWAVTRSRAAEHRFRQAGNACAEQYVSYDDFRSNPLQETACTELGARYNSVAPTRVLDTRSAAPIGPGEELSLPLPVIDGVPAADISAVVLNLTATRPTAAGHLTVYPDGRALPTVSNVNFVAGETVPNLVTVPMTNGFLRIRNGAPAGTVHVVADLQGYYTAAGQGYKPLPPVRVMDSRTGAGVPLAPDSSRVLDLTGQIPADATAAIVNLTVTKPTGPGHLTAYADGAAAPTASNLNFVAGQTIPNLAVVPVANGKARIHNHSAGTTHVVADLSGWFGPSGTDSLVPYGPTRISDSRSGAPLPPYLTSTSDIPVHYTPYNGSPVRPTATVVNLTVTRPTAPGVLTAYSTPGSPPAVSNVNFLAGETATNHAVVAADSSHYWRRYLDSAGPLHLVIDQSGYFATF